MATVTRPTTSGSIDALPKPPRPRDEGRPAATTHDPVDDRDYFILSGS